MNKNEPTQAVHKTLGDSQAYIARKAALSSLLTIYGRKPVLEALQDIQIQPHKLHLATSNKPADILEDIVNLARRKKVEIIHHDKNALSRISKNGKQDQGVALDICCPGFQTLENFLTSPPKHFDLIALDAITNPQNLGMIIRSVTASPSTAIVLPEKGCARLDPLVIKASAGALFKANILRCGSIASALERLIEIGASCYALDGAGKQSLANLRTARNVFVMGNETHGVSDHAKQLCTSSLSIPMARGVESLNVSVAASLVAFRQIFNG